MAIAPKHGQTSTLFAVIRELLETRAGEDYDLYARTIDPHFARVLRKIGFDRTWVRSDGQYLYDEYGNRYLDMLGGFGMFNVGRNNARIRAALVEVLDEAPGSVQLGASMLPGLLAEELLKRTPPRLARVLFTSSGTEAVDTTFRLARTATGRPRVLVAEHGCRGVPSQSGPSHVPFGDLEALERELCGEDVALFLVEPVQRRGVNLPPPGYLEGAQELCRRHDTLFAIDEVQTGFGRTGRLFGFEHWNLEPDLVTVAKSLSGGYVPVGALLMSQQVHDGVVDSLEHSVSQGPNDLAMAAGLASLRELDDVQLVERSRRLGELLLERTRPLADAHDVVRDVRGLGLMWGIEFSEPSEGTRLWRLMQRMQKGPFAQRAVVSLFRRHRILTQAAGNQLSVVKGLPPLVLTEHDVDDFATALDDVIGKATRPVGVAGLALSPGGAS